MFLVRILSLRLSITSKLIRNQLLMKAYCNSNHDDDEPEVFTGPIPRDKLRVKFSRSSGPGGQNVNKRKLYKLCNDNNL
jgi:protein subunit release factor B